MSQVRSIVIVGGGTAGWMAAAFLSRRFVGTDLEIILIESDEIGTIGVGEATVPSIKYFLKDLGIDEADFVRETNASFKLGIEFDGWHKPNETFFHPFASFGAKINKVAFHHYWSHLRLQGYAGPIDNYSLSAQIARAGKFALPPKDAIDIAQFNYAYHFDAGLFARYLRRYAEKNGVTRIEAKVLLALRTQDSGHISALMLHSGQEIAGDFFIDCSGMRGLLIEETLRTGYQRWSQWLLCDTAIAVPSVAGGNIPAYTRALACEAGWQWRIPLQHRYGNGYVYASRFISEKQAMKALLEQVPGQLCGEPKTVSFVPGMRRKCWNKNVFALGLASGFIEPLESTNIYMIQIALNTLFNYFPGTNNMRYLAKTANRIIATHNEKLRDFIILHYTLNQRQGEVFWDECRTMNIPDSLQNRLDEYYHTGSIVFDDLDFFQLINPAINNAAYAA